MIWNKISPRRWVQFTTLVLSNAYVFSFLRSMPCGFLNCSRCVVSTVKCPLLAFQTGAMVMGMFGVMAPKTINLLTLTSASLVLFASTVGTWTCAWLCPFGFVQDMLHKIPVRKFKLPEWVAWGRLPLFLLLGIGMSYLTKSLFFCGICPPGTIARLAQDAAGIPQFLKSPEGAMAVASIVVTAGFLVLSVFTYRPFCHALCPIGGLYGLFNKISGMVRRVETHECNLCGKCKKVCPQGLDPVSSLNTQSCNRCLECHKSCKALISGVRL
jgi:polyferredoxin